MDVERVKKINDLALELMKSGLAADREDAVIQAERTFRNRDSEEYSSMRGTMQEIKVRDKQTSIESKDEPELSQEDIKSILKQNTEFFVRKFREFQEKMDSLEKEVSLLRARFTYERIATQGDTQKREDLTVGEAAHAGEQKPARKDAPVHPRSGNYKQEDVSIEKFFYMGKQ